MATGLTIIKSEDLLDATVPLGHSHLGFHKSKAKLNLLKLETKASNPTVINLEPGRPYSAMWNVLKHMAHSGKKGQRRKEK